MWRIYYTLSSWYMFSIPGEIITKEIIDYILVCHKKGMNISGMKDPNLEYVQIIENNFKR